MSYQHGSRGDGKGLVGTLSVTFPVSVSFWYKTSAYPTIGDHFFGLTTNSGSTGRCLLKAGDGTIQCVIQGGTVAESALYTEGAWTHIGAVFNTSVTRLYVNNAKQENATGSPSGVQSVAVACLWEDSARYIAPIGRFAEVAIWDNTTLTDGNFTSLYNKVSPADIGGGPTVWVQLVHNSGYTDTQGVVTLSDGGTAMSSVDDEPGINAPSGGSPGSPAVTHGLWRSTILGLGHGGF